MRLRIPEAFNGRTAYEVARDSRGRIKECTLYRIVKVRGQMGFVALDTLQALCDVLGTTPGKLIEYERQP